MSINSLCCEWYFNLCRVLGEANFALSLRTCVVLNVRRRLVLPPPKKMKKANTETSSPAVLSALDAAQYDRHICFLQRSF